MVDGFERTSRKNRFEKKRSNTKAISWLSMVGGLLVILIIALIVFGGNDDDIANEDKNSQGHDPANMVEIQDPEDEFTEEDDNVTVNDEDNTGSYAEDNNQLEVEENDESEETQDEEAQHNEDENAVVESDDPNVSTAYEGNWSPVGTSQTGPHTTNYEDGSTDREEMQEAVNQALGIAVDNQVIWWAGRAGDQEVEVTVSPKTNQDETYRVQMQWVEEEGWQPTLVEELIENDRK